MMSWQKNSGFGAATAKAAIFPALLALGFWLLGIPLDWSSWKTYVGLIVITIAVATA